MKKMKFIVLLLVLSVFACNSTPKTETTSNEPDTKETVAETEQGEKNTAAEVRFGELSWIVEHISPSFWPTPLKNESNMFITFHMPISENLDMSGIEKILITSPKDLWLLEGSDIKNIIELDSAQKKLAIKRLQCSGAAVPLGEWNVDLILKNGARTHKSVNVSGLQKDTEKQAEKTKTAATAPAGNDTEKSETASSNEKIADTENAEAAADTKTDKAEIKYLVANARAANETSCLAIPVITAISRDADTIEIRFSVNDKRVKNGYFWFDVPGEKYYRDSGSMIDASGKPVNGCRKFSTDGKECLYILRKDKDNSAWFSKAIAAYFVVADVNRVQSPWEERIRSVSEKAAIK